jgi:RNA polymerase sigma-70 factor (ECF subfamily)
MLVEVYFDGAGFEVTCDLEDDLTNGGGIDRDKRWGELLAAAQRGDSGAYRDFLTAILPFARALARRRSWSEDMVEDVVQDVLLTVHRVRHTYEPGRPVKPWLAAIVARRSIDSMRRRGRIGTREVHDLAAYETYADPQANKEEAGDAARTIAQMTSGLSPGQKEALELVKLKEMSLAEASAASGQSVASLKVNIHRAIKKLRRNLARDQPE